MIRHCRPTPPNRATVTGIVLRDRPMLSGDYIRRVKHMVAEVVADPGIASQDDLARIQGMLAHLRNLHPRMARLLEGKLRGGT
jgi:hypothetical protein